MRRLLFAVLLLSPLLAVAQPRVVTTLQVPGRAEFCKIDTAGVSVLPSGRYVTPAGKAIRIANDPFGLAISPNGKTALTLHDQVLTVIDLATMQPTRLPRYGDQAGGPLKGGSFLGVAVDAGSQTAYLSKGDKGSVVVFDLKTLSVTDEISLNGPVNGIDYDDSFTADLTLNPATNELLVLDRGNFRLVRIDLATKKLTASISVGRQPFGLSLSPDRKVAFVANVGLFVYPLVPGVTKANKDTMMLKFPPYGTFSKEAREGVEREGRRIPGLGGPETDEAMSVWTVDLATNKVVSKIKTGVQIGSMIEEAKVVGGSSPNSVAVGGRFAYVSNATNDNITILDYKNGHKIAGTIPLKVDKRIDRYRGLMPFGLTLTNDQKTLYVALLAFNAVAVVDIPTRKVTGLIPTGWGPTKVALSSDQKTLYVTSARGYGAGPNGGNGFVKPPQGTYIGDIQLGTFQAIPIPDAAQLAVYTKQVLANTFRDVRVTDDGKNPMPTLPKLRSSPIKHIVYITKENRTYDEILGQLTTGRGDATLARFGVGVTVRGRTDTITHADVMPNHLRIARQWAYSDNFYCDSDASIHGHHWMMGTIPNEWVEANSSSAGTFKPFSKAPGRRFPKATGAIDPEDYNEIGGLWENLERNHIRFYNFGEANEYAGVEEEKNHTDFGAVQPVVFPLPDAVFNHTSRHYAGFNTNVPDQFRMDQFEQEFTEKWLSPSPPLGRSGNPGGGLPQLITMQVPNDHGAGPRPDAGYPFLHSYMADNDLAVGRILHFLSRTKYWKNMLVIITEDDPQGGVDHVDAHRSALMLAGPYVKRGYVSHTHANFGSVLKVIYNVLNMPYVNQYDATASLLTDFFTDKPDFTPYTAVLPDKRVFDPQKALDYYKKTFDWTRIQAGPQAGVPKMDDPTEQRAEHYRQQEK